MRQFQREPTIYVTENNDTSFKFTFKPSTMLIVLPVLNTSNCQSILEYLSLQHNFKLFKFL